MAIKANTFEGGTDGTTITAGNSGGASGDALENITIGAGDADLEFDNAHPAHGSLGARFLSGATATTVFADWTFTGVAELFTRFYLWLPSTTPLDDRVVFCTAAGGSTGRFNITNSSGPKLQVFAEGDFSNAIGTVAVTRDALIRIETRILLHASAGIVEAKLFNSPESATPSDTVTLTGIANTHTLHNRVRFGWNNNAATREYWMDSLAIDSAGYIGPFVEASPKQKRRRIVLPQAVHRASRW
jgi:hypothetical protein